MSGQEALHGNDGRQEGTDAMTGVYMGVMYTEYLDAVLAPQVGLALGEST